MMQIFSAVPCCTLWLVALTFGMLSVCEKATAGTLYKAEASGVLSVTGVRVGTTPLDAVPTNLLIANAGTGVLSELVNTTGNATADSFGFANVSAATPSSIKLGDGLDQMAVAEGSGNGSSDIATAFSEFLTNGSLAIANQSPATTYIVEMELQYDMALSASVNNPDFESASAGASVVLSLLSDAANPLLDVLQNKDHLAAGTLPVAETLEVELELAPGAGEQILLFVDAFGQGVSAIPEPTTLILMAFGLFGYGCRLGRTNQALRRR